MTDDDLNQFGSTYPAGYVPRTEEERQGVTSGRDLERWTATRGKEKKAKKQPTHYREAQDLLNKMHPGYYVKVENYALAPSRGESRGFSFVAGNLVKKDLMGFADVMGFADEGNVIFGQVTTKANVGEHMRKYVNPKETDGRTEVTIEERIRNVLKRGHRFYVLGYHQPGGFRSKWECEVTEVTPELLDLYISRKRKK